MSTTDTRAAFKAWWHQTHFVQSTLTIEAIAEMAFKAGVAQAATEAAKAEKLNDDQPVMYCVPDKSGKPLFGKGWIFAPIPSGAATMPLYDRPAAKAAGTAGELPPEWITEVCGPDVDGLSYGQGYRRGFNDCRKKVSELQAKLITDEEAWEIIKDEARMQVIDEHGSMAIVIKSPSEAWFIARAILAANNRPSMITAEDCPVCNGRSGGIGADGVENDCPHCDNGMVPASAPSPAVAVHLPSTPDEVIAFLGANFDASWTQGDKADWRYKISVHDLLSAFGDWEATPSPSLAVRDIPREPTSEMMEAANRQREVGGDTKDCWRAMWDAAMREKP